MENSQKTGGIENTLVYWLAQEISHLNHIFITRYIPRTTRTFDQMEQANRSGKQNLVEGSLENSVESNLKLSGVSRASYGELTEDYKDFLFKKGFPVWDKNDPRVFRLRKILIDIHETHVSHDAQAWHEIRFDDQESFANLMMTLCIKQGFLMDRFLTGIKNRFVREGGFREKLFLARRKALHETHGAHETH
ncbi:MAG: four helix bundle suffix domain-containing protein [Candidatus Gottesmanbacteria bacterium]|nr:four helix bundle suffix domain-containing protein [Candidatus Gottesmanbacteria bacterium]